MCAEQSKLYDTNIVLTNAVADSAWTVQSRCPLSCQQHMGCIFLPGFVITTSQLIFFRGGYLVFNRAYLGTKLTGNHHGYPRGHR